MPWNSSFPTIRSRLSRWRARVTAVPISRFVGGRKRKSIRTYGWTPWSSPASAIPIGSGNISKASAAMNGWCPGRMSFTPFSMSLSRSGLRSLTTSIRPLLPGDRARFLSTKTMPTQSWPRLPKRLP